MVTSQAHPAIRLSLPKVALYARFLVAEHLNDYAHCYMQAFTEHGIDVHTYFPPDETKTIEEQFILFATQHLQLLAEDKAGDQIEITLQKMLPGGQETLEELQARSAYIFQLGYIRKKVFKKFLPLYTDSVTEAIELIAEMDRYSLAFEKATNETYVRSIAQLLQLREEQLLEAQQLSGTGSYTWILNESRGQATPELLRMLQLRSSDDIWSHLTNIHVDDVEAVKNAFRNAIAHYSNYELRYRFSGEAGERIILTKGKVEETANGPVIKGTVMDITDVEEMLYRLEESRKLYREAQELARIGNWSWDIATGKVQWSEEVYNICEVSQIEHEQLPGLLKDILYPRDWQAVKRQLKQIRETGEPLFYIGNIRLRSGAQKIVEIKGKVVETEGESRRQVIGTIQDVTNEQSLIRRLQDTERRYRHMEAISHIGNWIIDLDKNKSEVTDEFLRIYGFTPEDEHPDTATIRSFVKEEDRPVLDANIEACKRDGTPYKYQCGITTKKGVEKTILARGEAVRDSTGRIYRIAGTIQDITKEQTLLQQLQRSEVLHKQAQTIGRIGNWVYDIVTGKVEWSDELYHIYQLDRMDAMALDHARTMMLDHDRTLLDAHFKRCLEQSVPYDCHYRITLPDGRVKHLRAKGEVAPDIAGKPKQLIGTVQDVTEQVNVEKRLREHQRFTQKITDIAPSLIGVYNINTGNYVFISMAIEKILGYNRQQVLDNGAAFLIERIHPDDLPGLMADNNAALARANEQADKTSDEIVEFKYRVKDATGNWHWFQTFGTVFERNEAGEVELVLNVSVDISGEKQAELALNHKNMLLQQSNSSLEEFAYIASHDLQEPLRKISTFGNMLETLQEEALTDTGKLYLRKIVDSATRMQQMISDVLSVSIISGNRTFQTENLQVLLDEVLVTLEMKIEQTNATIQVLKPLPEAKVVSTQFRQLFQNLIGNSLKFARKDVAPIIRIDYDYISGDDAYNLNLDKEKRYLRLVFADNGIGFSNNYAGKIFAIFQRLHGKTEYEGTGIGLAVCKKIVEHHNGIIFANSEPDKGATFTIIIPV